MRSRLALLTLALTASAVLPLFAHAAVIPFLGPIVPAEIQNCPAGWGAVIVVINNIIRFLLTLMILIVAPAMIAYAGFLLVANPFNPGAKEKAKSMLLNLVIGVVIALIAYSIVAAFMAALYKPGGALPAWEDIITTGGSGLCLTTGTPSSVTPPSSNVTTVTPAGPLPANTNCSPQTILAAVAGTGYSLTQAQANTLSCIAKPESSCGTNTSGATTASGKPTSASGMFQIVFGYNDTCHNLNIPVCTAAAQKAGYAVTESLNCSQYFSGGLPKAGFARQAAACQAAAADISCNTAAAACLIQSQPSSPFSPWTTTDDGHSHADQQACVTQFYTNTASVFLSALRSFLHL